MPVSTEHVMCSENFLLEIRLWLPRGCCVKAAIRMEVLFLVLLATAIKAVLYYPMQRSIIYGLELQFIQ